MLSMGLSPLHCTPRVDNTNIKDHTFCLNFCMFSDKLGLHVGEMSSFFPAAGTARCTRGDSKRHPVSCHTQFYVTPSVMSYGGLDGVVVVCRLWAGATRVLFLAAAVML
jgi:hypothetical protein